MVEARLAIVSCDTNITEHIKWKAPSFCHNGDDRVTFNLHRNGSLLLIFHQGAKVKEIKGNGRLIDDPTGRLEWLADDRACLRIMDANDLSEKLNDVKELVTLWIASADIEKAR